MCCVIQAEPALMYDAVNVFAHSVGSLDESSGSMQSANISCKSSNRWVNGTFLYDKLNAVCIILRVWQSYHCRLYYNYPFDNNYYQ